MFEKPWRDVTLGELHDFSLAKMQEGNRKFHTLQIAGEAIIIDMTTYPGAALAEANPGCYKSQ